MRRQETHFDVPVLERAWFIPPAFCALQLSLCYGFAVGNLQFLPESLDLSTTAQKSRCMLHCDADLSKRSLLAWIRDCCLGIVYLHIYCINPEWNGKLQKFVIKQITHTNVYMHTYARLGMGPACIQLAHRHACMYIIYIRSQYLVNWTLKSMTAITTQWVILKINENDNS